jgi:surface protein
VTNMEQMLDGAGSWDVSNVTDMFAMFKGASVFTQYIGSWDVSTAVKIEDILTW